MGITKAVATAITFAVIASAASPQTEPASLGPNPPADVAIPSDFGGNPIDFFDDYSWRLFASMVWPADISQPGSPDSTKTLDGTGPRVFEFFKTNADTFQPNGAAPGNFDQVASANPCGSPASQRDALVLAAFSKFEELQQAGFGNLVGPLITQNRTYVRYVTGYNRLAYDHIVANKLYLKSTGSAPAFPNGAIVTKSAWIEAKGVANPQRFYRRTAWIRDPQTGACFEQEMALVGLHIVQKTPTLPQWSWSTFEQVDNVPDGAAQPKTFHDGTSVKMPKINPFKTPTPSVPPPFNVDRITAIHPKTNATDARIRSLLAPNSVWSFYRLVMTQWPVPPNSPQNSGQPRNTFPGTNATTAFANTTMETFDQEKVSTGCMACHDLVGKRTDFVWSVRTHAFDPSSRKTVAQSTIDPDLVALRELMESVTR